MRSVAVLVALAALAASGVSQAIFECQTPAPATLPVYPLTNCEYVSCTASLGSHPLPTIENISNCGFPVTGGFQYAYIQANGNSSFGALNPPTGGPVQRPLDSHANQVLVPVPPNATTVAFSWEFYDAEGGAGSYNDAFEVSLINITTGLRVGNPLVYIDVNTMNGGSAGTCIDAGPLGITRELGAPLGVSGGPQIFFAPLPQPVPTAGAYLSIVCVNGSDDAVPSAGIIDDILFDVPYIPCLFTLSQPFGAGSLRLANSGCAAGATSFRPVTFVAGAYPNGWLGGIDIAFADVISELTFGFPFVATLNGAGASDFTIPGGIPPGINIYAGCLLFSGTTGALIQQFAPQNLLTQ